MQRPDCGFGLFPLKRRQDHVHSGASMADHSLSSDQQTSADFQQHLDTYDMFMGMTKWGIIACILILVFMAIFLL